MGCASSTNASSDEDAITESSARLNEGAAEGREFDEGIRQQNTSVNTNASAADKVVEQLQHMHTPTPSTSSSDIMPPAAKVSTSQMPSAKGNGNIINIQEAEVPPAILVKHETTKYTPSQMPGLSPGLLKQGWNSGHGSSPPTPISGQALGVEAARLRNGQDAEISMSEDEDEDDGDRASSSGEGFDMQRWKRYYQWNHRKPDDLLAFFWKRFDPRVWSLHCVSYRNQDTLFAPFQGENVIHGVSCRLEAALQTNEQGPASSTFGLLHSFADLDGGKQKVLGIFIVRGQLPPAQLLHVLDEEEWALAKAETQDPMVRDFVSGLLAPRSNKTAVQDFTITCSRVIKGTPSLQIP